MQTPQEADIFLIPLLNGTHAVGQVIEVEKAPENCALCFLTLKQQNLETPATSFVLDDLIAITLVQTGHFQNDTWPIIGFEQLPRIERVFQLADAKANQFEQTERYDPALVEAFINASHGLYPWDAFPDPAFFDKLLLNPDQRPPLAKMKTDFPA